MLVRFWGTRGSLPVALDGAAVREKVRRALEAAGGRSLGHGEEIDRFIEQELDFPTRHTFGGNTSCVEIETGGDEFLLCDLGSGARAFTQALLDAGGPDVPRTFHLFLSHVHWDHIMGFPFFTPAYIPGNTIRIYGCHAILEEALRRQQSAPCFPVDFDDLAADIEFVRLETGERYEAAGLTVTSILQPHGGDSYGYRFERGGKAVVYSTDAEHKLGSPEDTQGFVEFIHGADLVIFDAMYSLADVVSVKKDWGHSSNITGIDLCHRAGVKHYCMFHHEPIYDDAMIYQVLQETIRYAEIVSRGRELTVSSAYDGLEIRV